MTPTTCLHLTVVVPCLPAYLQLAGVDDIRGLHPDGYYAQCAERGSRTKSEATAQVIKQAYNM
jgi:hypothetical protein